MQHVSGVYDKMELQPEVTCKHNNDRSTNSPEGTIGHVLPVIVNEIGDHGECEREYVP
jgi:hypothetical protein